MNRTGKRFTASLLAMVMVLSVLMALSIVPVAAQDPWEGYLVPQDSTGSYGTDTLVELWANVTTDQVWGYQVDMYFNLSCVNVTDIDYTGGPFPNTGWHHYGNYVRFYGDRGGSGNLPVGTYKLATATLHGENPTYCVSDLEFQNNLVSDDNGDPIQNSYTNGTYTCGTAQTPEWPQFHYDIANTGNSPSNAPDDNTTKWIGKKKTGVENIGAATSSQAMIVGDKVFVYADDTVYALSKASGWEVWRQSIPGDTQAWGSWASPSYNDLLFVSAGYNLTKLNATTGAKLQEIAFPDGGYSCNGGPTVADGMVFGGSGGGNYYAFDENDLNTVVWTYATPTGGSAVSTPAVAAGKVVVGELTWGGASALSCIDETTGAVGSPGTWTTPLVGDVGGSAAIDATNNRVYVATFVDYTNDIGRLYALDFTTGAEVWNQTITYSDSTPAISGDYIYVSGSVNAPGVTYCFNSAGALQWDVPCGSWTMSPAVADGKLFTGKVGTNWGAVDGICVFDALTGAPVWSDDDDAGSSPSVAESDGMVVSIGNDGKVYAFGTPEEVDVIVDAPDACIPRQSQFTVDIIVDPKGAIPVYAAQYVLSFNSSVLRAETQVKGPFLTADGSDWMVVINTVDNTAGETEYSETRKDTTTGITDEGVLATITFTAIGDAGTSSYLNLSEVVISDPDVKPLVYSITNDDINICQNEPPVANATVYDDYNNVGSKYLCKVYFDASGSYDPNGSITYYRWDFGDGDYGTGMVKEHVYTSWNWNGTGYEPFKNASLTVTDDTPEPETGTNTTYFDVTVYIAGDANGDGIVNILDASMIGLEWMHTCNPPTECWRDTWGERADRADLNNDHVVNILDAVIVGTCWKHTAW